MRGSNENKFCDLCKKEVVDLSGLSRKDLINKIKDSEDICGKINKSQLDFKHGRKFNNKHLNKAALLVGLGAIIGVNEPVLANEKVQRYELHEKADWKSVLPVKKYNDTITIVGKVVDPDSIPLLGATILLKGGKIEATSDFDGNFEVQIPTSELSNENYLVFSYSGFETKEQKFSDVDASHNLELKIQLDYSEERFYLGYITYKQSFWSRVGNFFRNLF